MPFMNASSLRGQRLERGGGGKPEKKEKPRRLIRHICISTFSFVTPLPRRIMSRFMIIRYFLLTVDMSPVKTQPVSSEQQRQVETWSAIFDYSNHRFPTEQTMTIGKLHRCLPLSSSSSHACFGIPFRCPPADRAPILLSSSDCPI